jgi:ADP-heptose:LPS heptosyltransferase
VAVGRPPRPALVVLRALGLGDLLTAVPALKALAAAVPGRRVLLAPASLAEVVAAPLGYEVLDVHGVRAVPATLPDEAAECDVAVNLHGRGPQSHAALRRLRPSRLIAFAADGHDGPPWREDEHEVRRWCRLLEQHGIPADPSALDLKPPSVPAPEPARGATLVHPGAASAARRWPLESWASVIASELAAGHRVAITGGAGEVELAHRLASAAGLEEDVVLAGRTTVAELAAAVAAAERVVCGDTGVAHLATALRTPSVVLFGPTAPARWGPPRDRPIHRALWAGRTGDPHAAQPDPGLLEIPPETVIDELATLRSRVRDPRTKGAVTWLS